ncbi:uncharacterized protein [Euphorbia lathyris]|uniref:uncharacterized protein n=1 Tax=Euphorbia lathyris TaxID=212925 RepID=UPI003313F7F9
MEGGEFNKSLHHPPKEHDHQMHTNIKSKEAAIKNASGFACAEFGRYGYASGGGSLHSSPLKYTFLGNAHPCFRVKVFLSFLRSTSDCTFPKGPASIKRSL